eukprot:TRINITY_DN2661_c1_g1_i7.p1 TRINITY_DN2661_c1_g1~~TRINITY_DN2661_c1_g1_i7.p1  ORF type:complete len:346 (+),score=120.11 TRINITY_DN2661_c1_g1_i7:32-1039(+)
MDTDEMLDYRDLYAVRTFNPENTTLFKMTGLIAKDLAKLNEQIARMIEKQVWPPVRFQELICDYVKDTKERWWFLQVKAFRATPVPIPKRIKLRDSSSSSSKAKGKGKMVASTPSLLLEDDDEMAMAKRPRKDYKRTVKCKSCLSRFQVEELQQSLTLKMIKLMNIHLIGRGKWFSWFDSVECKNYLDDLDTSSLYQSFRVCKNCYDLYNLEKKLIKLELQFAKALGIPITEETVSIRMANGIGSSRNKSGNMSLIHNTSSSSSASMKYNNLTFNVDDAPMPDGWSFRLPIKQPVRPSRTSDDFLLPKLSLYRLIIYLHTINDAPPLASVFGMGK